MVDEVIDGIRPAGKNDQKKNKKIKLTKQR